MIHVCFGVYDKDGRYSKFTGTTITSIFENTSSEVTVHILHDNTMTLANYEKFVYLAGKYGQQIKFYNVEKICGDEIRDVSNKFSSHPDFAKFTIGTWYRLFFTKIFPEEMGKVIYLDSDIIVNRDIKKLWEIDIADKPLAAVPESKILVWHDKDIHNHYLMVENLVDKDRYFNAGVLLINLKRFRTEHSTLERGLKFVAEHPQCKWFDQDIFNYCFASDYIILEKDFNSFVDNERVFDKSSTIKNSIFHYTGASIHPDIRERFNRLWFKYFEKTPWFNAESIGHFYDGVRQIQHELQSRTIWMSKVMAGRQRAFFVPPNNLEPMKKVFGADDNDEIILAIGMESLQQLIDSMKKSKGSKLYFILTAQFPGVHATLTREGFRDGRDFVNGLIFLSEAHGVPMNSYPLIKAL